MRDRPIILWFRRDLRLADHPMLTEAVATERPLLPLYIADDTVTTMGAAARWRLELALGHFADRLGALGSRMTFRRGVALPVLRDILAELDGGEVWWTRTYDPEGIARDTQVKAELKSAGIAARSFPGFLLFEPMDVATGEGKPYRVYTPFWRAVKDRTVSSPLPAPGSLRPMHVWPASDNLASWGLGKAMKRGAEIVARHVHVGEDIAVDRLREFIAKRIETYAARRDFPAEPATSGLSENLTWGEIGPRTIWHTAQAASTTGAHGAGRFLQELVWREFAWHLLFHTPHLALSNWRPEWHGFPWRGDNPDAERWRRGLTGVPMVDAGMREMFVTGTMHNRVRMVVASYLTKHLLTDWRVGQSWFADCLVDWDPASNAMGWQWVAGSGPDAAPYFRIFNPETQGRNFDPQGLYQDRWIAEGRRHPTATALSYFDAVPRSWHLAPKAPYPAPALSLADGRARALDAYAQWSAT